MIGSVHSGCRIERKLGEGGMGTVYLATREADGRRVAVKFLPPEQARLPLWRTRFVRTAELVRRLAHPGIARVLAVSGEGEQPHAIMELVKGEPLSDRLRREKRFSEAEGVRIARDMARALAEAHRAGLVHRDVKPGNVLITPSGRVKVIDFGLGKNTLDHRQVLTFAGQVLGTPYYMAPEQWGAHEVDARCDIFALGSTLYHLVTGELPFRAERAVDLAPLIVEGRFKPPREVAPELSEDLEVVVLWMMEPDRQLRYQDMGRVADDLHRLFTGRSPDVPRLEEVLANGERRRHALVRGTRFTLGRRSTCRLVLMDRAVSREHAELVREPGGVWRVRDMGSRGGTYVREARVNEVTLKDRDTVRVGERTFVFRDGQPDLAASSIDEVAPARREVRSVPEPILRALINRSDRRAVLTLIEQLEPGTHAARVRAVRTLLNATQGPDVVKAAIGRLERELEEARLKAATRLFMITHERLGDRPEAWLAWWDQARLVYPEQVGPCPPPLLARPRLKVVKGETKRAIPLEGAELRVGRETKNDLVLAHGSVSRVHATILRLHERLAIRDEGSRLGTEIDGTRVRIAFLRAGDQLHLGKVKLVYEERHPEEPVPGRGGTYLIDPQAFDVLAELGHPCAATGLVGFVEAAEQLDWVDEEAAWFFPDDAEIRARVADLVRQEYQEQAQRAAKLLPRLLGGAARDAAGWSARLADRRRDLPTQVVPLGWGLPHPDGR